MSSRCRPKIDHLDRRHDRFFSQSEILRHLRAPTLYVIENVYWMKFHSFFMQFKSNVTLAVKRSGHMTRKIKHSINRRCCERLGTIKSFFPNNRWKKIKVKHGTWARLIESFMCALVGKTKNFPNLSEKTISLLAVSAYNGTREMNFAVWAENLKTIWANDEVNGCVCWSP